jgi:hypothetical protein
MGSFRLSIVPSAQGQARPTLGGVSSILRGRPSLPLPALSESVRSGPASLLKLQLRSPHINGFHYTVQDLGEPIGLLGFLLAGASQPWHAGWMPGKEIDPIRARSALEVIRQHPGMVLFVASPALVAVAVVWLLAGAGWAVLLLTALLVISGVAILRKR